MSSPATVHMIIRNQRPERKENKKNMQKLNAVFFQLDAFALHVTMKISEVFARPAVADAHVGVSKFVAVSKYSRCTGGAFLFQQNIGIFNTSRVHSTHTLCMYGRRHHPAVRCHFIILGARTLTASRNVYLYNFLFLFAFRFITHRSLQSVVLCSNLKHMLANSQHTTIKHCKRTKRQNGI